MIVGSRQFTPRLWAVALYVALLALMLWLAGWQLDRAGQKVSMREAARTALRASPLELQSIDDPLAAAQAYTRVVVYGRYDEAHQFLWDNRIHRGSAGYEVLIPLILDNGKRVLVNRGWVALGRLRSIKPDVSLPEAVSADRVVVEGWLTHPSRGLAAGPAVSVDEESWPKRLQYLDYSAIAELISAPVLPVVLQVQALDDTGTERTVLTERREWLVANWQPAASGPVKHYSYAFQWFAMALALTVLFVVVNLRRIDE